MNLCTILTGDARAILPTMADCSVNCVVTSPPYWGLRDYGVAGQIGIEPTLGEYLKEMVAVFREVRRVLRDDGTLWLNIGEKYAKRGCGGDTGKSALNGTANTQQKSKLGIRFKTDLPRKNMIGLPWKVAFALQSDGWILRSEIIWHKPNAMPESVKDRPTRAHEYIFLMAKKPKYYYDAEAIKEPVTGNAHARGVGVNPKAANSDHLRRVDARYRAPGQPEHTGLRKADIRAKQNASFAASVGGLVTTRNKRTVWTVPTEPYKGDHYATFPQALIAPCILAGCPVGGMVLDPFGGAGTVGKVAVEMGRRATLIELNAEYVAQIRERLAITPGLPI